MVKQDGHQRALQPSATTRDTGRMLSRLFTFVAVIVLVCASTHTRANVQLPQSETAHRAFATIEETASSACALLSASDIKANGLPLEFCASAHRDYANNSPYKFTDPDGRYIELAVEGASIAVGATSAVNNISAGKYLAATADVVGVAIDLVGAAVPLAPGVAGLSIQASRLSDEALQVADEGVTTLYRAVGPDELSNIRETGELINKGSAEGKYFASSSEGASSYARQAVAGFGDAPYTTVKVDVPNKLLPNPTSVDRGIPAYVLPNESLKGLKPEILDTMALPD